MRPIYLTEFLVPIFGASWNPSCRPISFFLAADIEASSLSRNPFLLPFSGLMRPHLPNFLFRVHILLLTYLKANKKRRGSPLLFHVVIPQPAKIPISCSRVSSTVPLLSITASARETFSPAAFVNSL